MITTDTNIIEDGVKIVMLARRHADLRHAAELARDAVAKAEKAEEVARRAATDAERELYAAIRNAGGAV